MSNSLTKDDFVKHDVDLYFLDITCGQKLHILINQKLRELIENKIKEMNSMSMEEWAEYNPEIDELLQELLAQAIKEGTQ